MKTTIINLARTCKRSVTAAIIVSMFFAVHAAAQTTAVAAVTSNIVTPIALVKTVDMNFGNIAVSATVSGTAVMDPSGTRTTGGAGGVTFPATTGVVSPASFNVIGQPGYSFAITLPSGCLLSDGSSHSMLVNNFVSDPAITGTLDATGMQILKVSATLNVAAGQVPGNYQNAGGVPVTVNYN